METPHIFFVQPAWASLGAEDHPNALHPRGTTSCDGMKNQKEKKREKKLFIRPTED